MTSRFGTGLKRVRLPLLAWAAIVVAIPLSKSLADGGCLPDCVKKPLVAEHAAKLSRTATGRLSVANVTNSNRDSLRKLETEIAHRKQC